MNKYRKINGTRYIINRVFIGNSSVESLIESRVKSNVVRLTRDGAMMYNDISGSVQSQEVQL